MVQVCATKNGLLRNVCDEAHGAPLCVFHEAARRSLPPKMPSHSRDAEVTREVDVCSSEPALADVFCVIMGKGGGAICLMRAYDAVVVLLCAELWCCGR